MSEIKEFAVIRTGGSVGEQAKARFWGSKFGTLVQTFDSKDEAKDFAKVLRKTLTKGERRYWKLSYCVVDLDRH